MKTIKICFGLMLAILIVSSCNKDVLEVSSTTQISAETFWQTESDATLAIDGTYNSLQDFAQNILYLNRCTHCDPDNRNRPANSKCRCYPG